MKKKFCLFFGLVFFLVSVMPFSVLASDIMPLNNNTAVTKTSFVISSTGDAIVSIKYDGYPNITTGATISIKIEKRNLLFFWSDVVEDTITVNNYYYTDSIHYHWSPHNEGH